MALATALPAQAQAPVFRGDFFDRGDNREDRGPEVRPLHEIVHQVRAQLDGDFIGLVRMEDAGYRSVYVLRWRFSDERVAEIRVDASTGQVLNR
jgi:uncharacterized membrane protein YkoI